jgi:hypothetical protein
MSSSMLMVALRDQLSISTWLVLGASVQSLLFAIIPPHYAALPAVSYLLYSVTRTTLQVLRWAPSSSSPPPITGGYYSAMPPASLSEPQPIVVFVLGFQSSHPLGRLGPGLKDLGQYFMGIIKEAEDNKTTSGYLGTSGPMLTMDGTTSNALVTITYWRSLEELAAFSKQGVHAKTMRWFNENRARYPHIGKLLLYEKRRRRLIGTGIMHETYNCPAGQHENIYNNFRPFGQVNTTWEVDNEMGEKEIMKAEPVREGQGLPSMMSRMSRGEKS